MAYTKQVWNKGDENASHAANEENDALVVHYKLNHIEQGLEEAARAADNALAALEGKADQSELEACAAAIEELQERLEELELVRGG